MPDPAICFAGKKCRMGAMHPAYTDPLWHLINEERPGLGRTGPVGYLSQKAWIERQASSSSGMRGADNYVYVIFAPDQKLPIGTMSLGKQTQDSGLQDGASTTWWATGTFIGSNWRGQGVGTQAKMLLLRWASLNLPPLHVYSSVFEFNTASLRTQQKCGYQVLDPKPAFAPDAIHYRHGKPRREVWLRVATGPGWLTEVWNPYAKEHKLGIWDPNSL